MSSHLHEGDQSILEEQKKSSMKEYNQEHDKRKYATRKASCITAEDTELLVLDLPTCHKLY